MTTAKVPAAAKMRQSGPLSGWPYHADEDYDVLVDLLRDLRPWNRRAIVRDRLHTWARGEVDRLGCQDVADEVARIGRDASLPEWTDTVVARVAMDMLHNVAVGHRPWELGGSLLSVQSLPARTRTRHRNEGKDYLYRRRRRENDLRQLVARGRSVSAARRWLERHPDKNWLDAPPPQTRQTTDSGGTRLGSKRL